MTLPSALDLLPLTSSSLLVGLDFDGTLAPIVPHPDDAQLLEGMRAAIAGLLPRHAVVVLSGRGVDDLRPRVGLEGVLYGGCHGLQLRGPLERDHEGASALRPDLDAAAEAITRAIAHIPGALVEHKGLAVAIHRRRVDPALHPAIDEAVTVAAAAHPGLRRKGGKMIDELIPDVPWNKGEALLFAAAQVEARPVIFVGDDVTDEDAFAALADEGLGHGILVAETERSTAATHRLQGPAEVLRFLRALA